MLWALGGCGLDPGNRAPGQEQTTISPAGEVASAGEVRISPPVDLGVVMDNTHFAFRQDGATWSSLHATHEVLVAAGAVSFKPRHYDDDKLIVGAPLGLETVAIERTEPEVGDKVRAVRLADDGSLELDRGIAVERWRNSEIGAEQSWYFAAEPEGHGDVVVRVRVTGMQFVAANDTGLHFADPDTLGVRYGHATWIDASGLDTVIAAEYVETAQGGEIRMTIPGAVATNAAYPAVLDPVVEAEVAVDSPVVGPTGAHARAPQIASSGAGYLAVWEDRRNEVGTDIYAARIASDGTVQDTLGIAVSTANGSQNNATVAFASGVYVVAWEDQRSFTDRDIYAATVSGAGSVTQLGGIATGAGDQDQPDLADGATGLLVYRDAGAIRGARFTGVFTPTFAIASGGAVKSQPAAALGGSEFLVVWSEGASAHDLRGVGVTTLGGVGTAFDISAAPGSQVEPAVAFDGTNFAVVWSNSDGTGRDIYGTRVTTADAVLDTRMSGMDTYGGILLNAGANSQIKPSVDCGGSHCLVVWEDLRNRTTPTENDIFGLLLNLDFTMASGELTVTNAIDFQFSPDVAFGGSTWLAVWQDRRSKGPDYVFGTRVDSTGAILDPDGVIVSTGNNRQRAPSIGRSSTQYLVAWSDSREVGNNINGVRVSNSGTNLDGGAAKLLSNGPGTESQQRVSFIGANYMLVWSDSRSDEGDIYIGRINGNGGRLDGNGLVVAAASGHQIVPDIATDGTNALVVWQDRRNPPFDIYGAIVSSTGAVITGDIVIASAAGDQFGPRVAYSPDDDLYVVVWSDERNGAGASDVFATRVMADGTVLDPGGVAISTASGVQSDARISYGFDRFLVVWSDSRAGALAIYGNRIDLAGGGLSVLDGDGFAISSGADSRFSPAVSRVNDDFVVVWTDARNFATTDFDIYGTRVSTGGAVLEPAGFVVSASADRELSPDIIRGNTGRALVAYESLRPGLETLRVSYRRLVQGSTEGQPCTNNSQCDTGFCVDNVCCDSACGGGIDTDCQACSSAKGAVANGTCSPANTGYTCRKPVAYCDAKEVCDGVSLDCPTDVVHANTVACRRRDDAFCDIKEFCDGVNVDCPEDLGQNEGMVCDATCGNVCPANDMSGAPHNCPPCP